MNCAPRSEEISFGTPKRDIQAEINARAQELADMSDIGTASGHRVNLSTIVNKYVKPREGGSGPTMSMLMCSKRRLGTLNGVSEALTWRWTFERWQAMQAFAQALTCLSIPFHMNFIVIRWRVARIDG